jgi:hypothetical protein
MPSSLYIPFLLAGMIVTVRPALLLSPLPLILYPGFQQLHLVQMAGKSHTFHRPSPTAHFTQDMQCVENCSDPNSRHHVLYEQPVWQTLQMFRTSKSTR